jgi:regulation of enolase protein 1 (concanavalin A-like superfamily)
MTNAPGLVTDVTGNIQLVARVSLEPRSTFDAGVLLAWIDGGHWAKLCLEYSPQGKVMIVSVVTRGVSDDANSVVVDEPSAWLRLSRIGRAYAFHASIDGVTWQFVRHFALGSAADPSVGFLAQSPTGAGCEATFAEIRLVEARLSDLRSGV